MNCSKFKPRIVAALIGRDEAHNLPKTLSSMLHQTLEPDRVIYVDDASKDGSAEIAEEHGCEVVRLTKRHPSYTGKPQLSLILNEFVRRIDFRKYDFMLTGAGDVVLPLDYLERLSSYMMEDETLVIAGGVIQGEYNVRTNVRGAGRLYKTWFWRKHIKKFPLSYTFESYPLSKAQALGFKTYSFPDLVMIGQRATMRYKPTYGYAMRELGYDLLYAVARCFFAWWQDNPKVSVQMLATYLTSPYEVFDERLKDWIRSNQRQEMQRWINPRKILGRIKKEIRGKEY